MTDQYSIPHEAELLLRNGILKNKLHRDLPAGIEECAALVRFEGSNLPNIPINWRFAESMAALKGFEAAMIGVLLQRKYNSPALPTVVNTDHAQLLFMSSLVLQVSPPVEFEVNPTPVRELSAKYAKHFPPQDPHNFASSFYRRASTNIYKTKDGRFIHLHGSLNPDPTIRGLRMPLDDASIDSREASYQPYMAVVARHEAEILETYLNEEMHQACTIVNTPQAYRESDHGKANANTGLYEVHRREFPTQKSCWWPSTEHTSLKRPLAGLKVLDLTRVIAGPSASRGLAELGASVMRVTAKHLPDFTGLHPDLNWGKWNCCLDLRVDGDRERLKQLVVDVDVVVDGYRPGVFEKYGFGVEGVLKMCEQRSSGVIYARENTYGWNGPWRNRSGWQPISDANTGVSYGFGRAMGNDEPCTPVFPNSDYCTGVAGCVGIIQALLERAEHGGSYVVDFALNYYNQWLVNSCGTYPEEVWQDVWSRNGRRSFRHFESMNVTVPAYLEMLKKNASETILRSKFFERRTTKALGLEMQVVNPAIEFPKDTVQLGYNVGTRGNGLDQPYWPSDLLTEVVK